MVELGSAVQNRPDVYEPRPTVTKVAPSIYRPPIPIEGWERTETFLKDYDLTEVRQEESLRAIVAIRHGVYLFIPRYIISFDFDDTMVRTSDSHQQRNSQLVKPLFGDTATVAEHDTFFRTAHNITSRFPFRAPQLFDVTNQIGFYAEAIARARNHSPSKRATAPYVLLADTVAMRQTDASDESHHMPFRFDEKGVLVPTESYSGHPYLREAEEALQPLTSPPVTDLRKVYEMFFEGRSPVGILTVGGEGQLHRAAETVERAGLRKPDFIIAAPAGKPAALDSMLRSWRYFHGDYYVFVHVDDRRSDLLGAISTVRSWNRPSSGMGPVAMMGIEAPKGADWLTPHVPGMSVPPSLPRRSPREVAQYIIEVMEEQAGNLVHPDYKL